MSRRLKIIFTISVLLNVLLLGVAAGSYYRCKEGPRRFSGHDSPIHEKFMKAMKEARQDQEALYGQMRAAKKELIDTLSAPAFDEEAFRVASEKMNRAQQALFQARNDTTLKMAKEMSADERQAMAKHMKEMSDRRWRGGQRFYHDK